MINIDKVSKSYGKDQVLDEVGLSIDKGKFTAFIGPNGAGKSTTDRKSTRLNSSHIQKSRMPSSA